MRVEVEDFAEARRRYEDCASRYAGRPEASEAGYRVGELLETRLKDLPAAVEAYEKVTGPWQNQARQRLAVLREKRLVLRTERVFQTDEKPVVKVVSRNLPKLRVRVFKLALDDFFEGTLGRTAIEALAIEAISPDASFESAVDPYVRYAETERDVPLPFDGAGAYVVKVDDGELESSTLVLVSDLAVVTKTSRKELFVFAEDTRQVRPQAGARIVVTDGAKVLGEGVTDERGAFRFAGKEVEGAGRLYVLASTAQGSAATTMDLGDLYVSQGLVAKTFVYTDRRLYRPGEVVHAKAVLREVDGGRYVLPKDEAYEVDWLDAGGRLLSRQEARLSPFGTLEVACGVPSQGGHGSYTVRVHRKRDRSTLGAAQVTVGDFSTPRVSLVLESEHEVLLRGDKLAGRVEARFFFGGPVRDRAVQVVTHIDGVQRVLQGRTDAAGGFDFEFDTSEALGEQLLTVQAAIPSEQAYVQKGYHLRTTAFDLALELPSDVYLVGEDLEARATVEGPGGKKLARKLRFELFRMEATSRGQREVPVATAEAGSDAETGRATARFALEKGGTHRLRASAVDRFGNTIETSRTFFVSGKDDEVKLRLLSRVQYAKVGDELAVRVVNRAGPRLCLVTYEGDGVLAFEAKVFGEGETDYRIPLDERHAPNFALGLAMVDGRELHQASRHFLVARPLEVKVVPGSERALPGGKVKVDVECRDPSGKPVPAELSVAVVDEALLALSPDDSPSLQDVFYGAEVRRSLAMRTQSSCTFAYEGQTRGVNAALLAEEAARERSLREAEERKAWAHSDDFVTGRSRSKESMDKLADMPAPEEAPEPDAQDAFNDVARVGGGAGGAFGGRFGGRRAGGRPGQSAAEGQDRSINLVTFGGIEALRRAQAEQSPSASPILGFFDDDLDGDFRGRTENYFSTPLRDELEKLNAFGIGQQLVVEGRAATAEAAATPRVPSQAFAVWVGAVTTGADGKGSVEIVLPDKAGSWKLRARAVGNDAWFGEDEAELVTAKDLFVRVGLPGVLTEGDEARGELSLHRQGTAGVDAAYAVRHGDTELCAGKEHLDAGAEVRRPLPFKAAEAGDHVLTAKVEGGGAEDTLEQPLRVLSWSLEEQASRSGAVSGAERVALKLPEGATYRAPELLVELGPEAPDAFLVAGWARRSGLNASRLLCYVPETHANRTALALAALSLLGYRQESAPDEKASLMLLRHRVESAIAELQSLENNGEIAWIGRGGIDARTSLLAWLLLERARAKGFVVDEQVVARMRNRLSAFLRDRDTGLATLAFLVTAEAGIADFARFNTLYRSRGNMDLGARARLVLAAHAMKRPELGVELVEPLAAEVERQLPALTLQAEDRKRVRLHPYEDLLWALVALARA
ncbi:MAG: MG2 domain-containing protein, partial [Planctomycetota bacterium]